MTIPTKLPDAEVIERVVIQGDLSKLTPEARVIYYRDVCQSLGLNWRTKPFDYIVLNNKLTLYARRDCADQLRKINGISIEIVSQDLSDGLYTVHVKARDSNGRQDEDLGVVPIPDHLKGENRSNATMKAVTKAKRRVTLSICGLGFLDETEVEDIPGARRPPQAAPNVMRAVEPPHDSETGEVLDEPESSPPPPHQAVSDPQPTAGAMAAEAPASRSASDAGATRMPAAQRETDKYLHEAAMRGSDALQVAWSQLTNEQKKLHKAALDVRHKLTAANADAEIANDLAARE